jgi:hypothetical protein
VSTAPASSPGSSPEAAAAQLVIQIASGHLLASALQTVVQLRIPDRLAGGARTAAEIAAAAGVQEDGHAGFELTRVVPTESALSVVEAYRAG